MDVSSFCRPKSPVFHKPLLIGDHHYEIHRFLLYEDLYLVQRSNDRRLSSAIFPRNSFLRLQCFCSLQGLKARRVRENGETPFPLRFRRRSEILLTCHGCS